MNVDPMILIYLLLGAVGTILYLIGNEAKKNLKKPSKSTSHKIRK